MQVSEINELDTEQIESFLSRIPLYREIRARDQDQFERLQAAFAETIKFRTYYTSCPETYALTLYDPSGCRREWLSPRCEDDARRMTRIDDEDPNWAQQQPPCPRP